MKFLILSLLVLLVLGGAGYWIGRTFAPVKEESKVYRIGILQRGSFYETAVVSYKRKMAELGYVEGRNTIFDLRIVSTKEEMTAAVRDFIRGGVDLIHSYSTPATVAAYEETKNLSRPIPIVFGSMGDPLAAGVIKNTKHPGTNVTGVVSLSTELTARRIELLHQINPKIKRVAMPHTALDAGDVAAVKSVAIAKSTAKKLGMEIISFPIHQSSDNPTLAKSITADDVDGVIISSDSLALGAVEVYAKRAIEEKLPFAAFDLSNVQKGALVGFGPDYAVSGEQAALLSNQILRGTDPADIPLEIPQKLLLAVNLDTAKKIGVSFDAAFLKEADVIIGSRRP